MKKRRVVLQPRDRSHSFIGNQAAGQARGHHGNQVTNQQGVTWLLRHTQESRRMMHEASRQSHQSRHMMHEASRQSHQSRRMMHEASRQSHQSWRRVHNMVGLSRQSHLSWHQDCQDNLDHLDRPALYSLVIVPLWNNRLQLMLWSRQLDLLQYNPLYKAIDQVSPPPRSTKPLRTPWHSSPARTNPPSTSRPNPILG